jgi:VIT1/CCC1 family predicted Fe2+/Mn2+ transporter
LTLIKILFEPKADACSAMASVPISGELIGSYGYLALSLYSGVSMLIGSFLLLLARFAQERRLLAVV